MIQPASMDTDDFSFPTLTEPLPRFIASPSLWRVSSCHGDTRGNSSTIKSDDPPHRKSLSSFESGVRRTLDDTREDDEEKMDMLWEDFNDELQGVSSLKKKKESESLSKIGGREFNSEAAGKMVELCCVKALKMSKTSSSMISPRRPNMLVIFKVMKKFFLLHNSHCS